MPTYLRLFLYLTGLVGVGYVTWSCTSDPWFTGAIVLIAHWIKPYRG